MIPVLPSVKALAGVDRCMTHAGWSGYVDGTRERVRSTLTAELRVLDLPGRMIPSLVSAGQVNRGVLTILVGEALGAGDGTVLIRMATAIELVHRASVIHDDIQDGDRLRRGVPTFHVSHGLPIAVAVSDVLLSHALVVAGRFPDPGFLLDVVATYQRMSRGQLMDFVGTAGIADSDWTLPSRLKTGSLVELAFRSGARGAGVDPAGLDEWSAIGQLCGSAFQLINDVRNARNEEDRGAIASSDLAEGRFSSVRLAAEAMIGGSPLDEPGHLETVCAIVEEEAGRRMAEAAHRMAETGPDGLAGRILTLLTTPDAAARFTLQDPER
ncbi:polyprenyl synthetase family protein [Actinoplanes sp. NPDC051494]|uniref:polyprenyl synthetase family protein n=1 Tax=Actinoplanes sp. NPDC051494 TaxID=3363907 RepID=UPI003793E1FE